MAKITSFDPNGLVVVAFRSEEIALLVEVTNHATEVYADDAKAISEPRLKARKERAAKLAHKLALLFEEAL